MTPEGYHDVRAVATFLLTFSSYPDNSPYRFFNLKVKLHKLLTTYFDWAMPKISVSLETLYFKLFATKQLKSQLTEIQ